MVASMNPGRAARISHRQIFGLTIGAFIICLTACQTRAASTPTQISTTTIASSTSTRSTAGSTTIVETTTTDPNPTTRIAITTACRVDPFAGPFSRNLESKYPGKKITAHLYDTRTGCHYELNAENRQPTASVFKVMVMAGTLLEAQAASRSVSDFELSQLTPMITRSTNPQVRALWRSFGGSPWFRVQADLFGLDETSVTADGGSAWGRTMTSSSDQVYLLRQLLIGDGGLILPEYRAMAIGLMTSIAPEQTWGVTAGVPSTWKVAQKNGFAGSTTNSIGWVDEPGDSDGYLVAILSTGWPNFRAGIPAVEAVNEAIAAAMFDTVPGVE